MKQRLGGSIFIRNAISLDYHIEESVTCLKELCDEVVVLDAGSDDQTTELVRSMEDKKTKVILCSKEQWEEQKTQYKLSYFTNLAISALSTEWNINLQGDEIISEKCYDNIRRLIELPNEGYFSRRINLWGNSQHRLNVEESRLPVGEKIVRLAKTNYQSVVDAQSIACDANWDYIEDVRIYHTGFIRDKRKHMVKIENMMCNIFGWGMDEKLKSMGEEFDPWKHFSKEDVTPINEPLPLLIQEWCKLRDEINNFNI